MPSSAPTWWTIPRLAELLAELVSGDHRRAAEVLGTRWGRRITPSAIRHALRDSPQPDLEAARRLVAQRAQQPLTGQQPGTPAPGTPPAAGEARPSAKGPNGAGAPFPGQDGSPDQEIAVDLPDWPEEWGPAPVPDRQQSQPGADVLEQRGVAAAGNVLPSVTTGHAPGPDAAYQLPGGATWGREAEAQRRQEYSRRMGETADYLRAVLTGEPAVDPADVAAFERALSSDEETYVNRQRARSVSLALARDILFLRTFEAMARRTLQGRITPVGYAARTPHDGPAKRTLNLLLSDLHLGARLVPEENPEAFGVVEEARRLSFVIQQAADWKPQYRDATALNVLLAGDLIEGQLLHDLRDGAPLAEQATEAIHLLGHAIGYLASAFPRVDVWCQTGNHGRNKLRHEGRATSSKWDSYEYILYRAAQAASSALPNVHWHAPRAPVCLVPLHDRWMLLTHGDTELHLAAPGRRADLYERALNQINASSPPRYGQHIDLLAVGHWHEPTLLQLRSGAAVVNGALVPPAGYARTAGYDSQAGQWLWESVPGHALGDARLVRLGTAQDSDAALDRIVPPFRWEEAA